MKKIILALSAALLLLPITSEAAIAVGWNATSTTQGWISPTRVNGIDQAVQARYYIGTSTATSTLAGGLNLTSGCFAVGGTCLTTSGGSGTVSSSLQGYNAFYNANGTVVSGTSTIFTSQSSLVSISTTTNSDANGNNALTVQGVPGTDVLNLTDGIARFGFYIKNNSIVAPIQMGSITNQDYGFFTNNGSPQLTLRTNGNNGFGTSTSPNRLTVQAAGATNYLTSGAASTFFVDTGTNNYAAEFKGNGANYTGFLVTNTTSTGAPFVQFDNTANSKLWTIMEENTNNFSVREGSATGPQDLTIAAGGNVGISSTTPGSLLSIGTTNGINITPTATSTFNNAIRSTCFTNDGTICITSGGGGGSSTDKWATSSLDTNLIYPNSAQMAALGTTSAQAMFSISNNTITNNTALVDIGATNASPYNLRLFRYDVPGALTQYFFDNSGNLVERNTSTTAGLQFGTNGGTRLTIDANGNAGVGTTTPATRLFVAAPGGSGVASIQATSVSGYSSLDFYNNTGSLAAGFGYGNPSNSVVPDKAYFYTNAKDLQFAYNTTQSNIAMTISGINGHVGIGTTTPNAALTVQATSGNIFTTTNNGTSEFTVDSTGLATSRNYITNAGGSVETQTLAARNGGENLTIRGASSISGASVIVTGTSAHTQTSGSVQQLAITPIYNQAASSAANTDLLINRTETSIGTGAQVLFDAQVSGSSKFLITNTGNVGIASSSPFTKLVVGGNSYLGGNVTATGTLQLPALATAAGSILAVDGSGFVISTTSPPATVTSGTSQPVKYATTGALPSNTYLAGVITEVGNGALSVDGASPAVADRVLVKNEATAANNGIYTVTAAGSGIAAFVLTRASDYNSSTNIYPGIATYVISGTANSDDWWAMTSSAPITVGTTALNYTESSGGVLSAGTGITISGTTVSVNQAFTPTWSGLHTFTGGILGNNATSTITNHVMVNSTSTNATTTVISTTLASTTNLFISGLGTPAGTSLAVDPTGKVIATTTSGGVTAIGVTTANGVSGTSSGGSTPNLTISLGAITPTSVNGLPLSLGTNSVSTNIAIGNAVLGSGSLTGTSNVGLGFAALNGPTSGARNIAIGTDALNAITTGSDNVGVGSIAGSAIVGGSTNTAIGSDALGNFGASMSGNVALGYHAGFYESTSNNFYVDNQDRTNTAGDKAGALLYGTFNATPASQTLTVNGTLSTSISGSGTTNVVTVGGAQTITNKNIVSIAATTTSEAITSLSSQIPYANAQGSIIPLTVGTGLSLSGGTLTATGGSNFYYKTYFPKPAIPYNNAGLSSVITSSNTIAYVGMIDFPQGIQVNKLYGMVVTNDAPATAATLQIALYNLSGTQIFTGTSTALGTAVQGTSEHLVTASLSSQSTVPPGQYYELFAVKGGDGNTQISTYNTQNVENGNSSGWASTTLPMAGTYTVSGGFTPSTIAPSSISTSTNATVGVIRFDN